MQIFERLESGVRSYSRSFPVTFRSSSGPWRVDVEDRRYIDFFCGAGALNYGHNEAGMKRALIQYIESDGIMHSLDMATQAKSAFLERFEKVVLSPRRLSYRVQFTGPTGANAVEASLKLVRKVTRRRGIVAFTRAYHGLSAGALSVTANAHFRDESYIQRGDVTFLPYDGYLGPTVDTMAYFEQLLDDDSSGLDTPAAVIVETVQAEGGVHVASREWLQALQALCRQHEVLLIIDDIQAGCGRTGRFFSFEDAGLTPDFVLLSKSISGFGFPMSLVLIRPDLDQWRAAEHTGTFRGNNAAFVTAAEALRFWQDETLERTIAKTRATILGNLEELGSKSPGDLHVRGKGLLIGVDTSVAERNRRIARECFERGLVLETCGGHRNVIKLLPPLNIPAAALQQALDIFAESVLAVPD